MFPLDFFIARNEEQKRFLEASEIKEVHFLKGIHVVTPLSSLEFPGLATKGVDNNLAHTCVSK